MKKQSTHIISIILIILGGMSFVAIGGISVWADVEAAIFDMARRSSESIPTLKCPIVITTDEIGIVSASFSNPSGSSATPLIRTRVTDGFVTLKREYNNRLILAPGETETVEIRVNADNAAYKQLILVRMHQFGYDSFRYRNASCGILVLNIPFITGSQFVVFIVSLGVLFSILGIYLWFKDPNTIKGENKKIPYELLVYELISFLVALIGLSGKWLFGILIILFWVIYCSVLIIQTFFESNNNKINAN